MSTPRFFADEDFRRQIVQAARQLCPALDLVTVQELGLDSSADDDLLDFAAQTHRIMVSHDTGTMIAAAIDRVQSGLLMPGLFVVPQDRMTRPVAESIQLVAEASQAEEWHSTIVYLPI